MPVRILRLLTIAAALVISSSVMLAQRGQGPAPAGPPALQPPADFGTRTGQRIRVTMVAGGVVPSVEPGVPRRATIW